MNDRLAAIINNNRRVTSPPGEGEGLIMTRKQVLASIEYAGYHSDQKTFIRLYTENKISYRSASEAYQSGIKKKQSGMKCGCAECQG